MNIYFKKAKGKFIAFAAANATLFMYRTQYSGLELALARSKSGPASLAATAAALTATLHLDLIALLLPDPGMNGSC